MKTQTGSNSIYETMGKKYKRLLNALRLVTGLLKESGSDIQ